MRISSIYSKYLRFRPILLLLVAGLIMPTITQCAKGPDVIAPVADAPERICYIDNSSLCTMDADGKDMRLLSRLSLIDYGPYFTPDQRMIAWQDRGGQITVMNSDGNNKKVFHGAVANDEISGYMVGISPAGDSALTAFWIGMKILPLDNIGDQELARDNVWDNGLTAGKTSIGMGEGTGIAFVWPCFTPDGKTVLYGDMVGNLVRYDLASRKDTIVKADIGKYALPPQFDPAGKDVVYCNGANLTLTNLADWNTRALPITLDKDCRITDVAYNGKRIVYLLENDFYPPEKARIELWSILPDGTNNTLLYKLDTSHRYSSLALNRADSSLAYVDDEYEKTDQLMICKLDLRTLKTSTVGAGEHPRWTSLMGEPIKAAANDQVGLPATYKVKDTIIADFDGDGKDETVYSAIAPTLRRFAVWMVKNNAVSWRMPDDETAPKNETRRLEGIKALDINGDGRPELCLLAGEHQEEFWQYFWAYSWKADAVKNIAAEFNISQSNTPFIKVGEAGIPATLAYEVWQEGERKGLNLYTWDGNKFTFTEMKALPKSGHIYSDKEITALKYVPIDEALK